MPQEDFQNIITECVLSCLKHHKFEIPKVEDKNVEYLTGKQVDLLLTISAPTRHKYANKGLLKKHKIGGRVLYKKSEILKSLRKVEAKRV